MKFEIGDRVRHCEQGLATVCGFHGNGIGIRLDRFRTDTIREDCWGTCEPGYGYRAGADYLTLIERPAKETAPLFGRLL